MTDPLTDPVSETARWTAASRARESARPDALFTDPLAEHLATDIGRRMLARSDVFDDEDNPFLPIRTRWLDDRAAEVVRGGVAQVVLVAAGLDTRAFRVDWPAGTVVFELDLPDLLAAKQTTLDEVGAEPRCDRRPVGTDLTGSWRELLAAAGHRDDAPTLWIVEGLLVYLLPEDATTLLTDTAAASAPGSALVTDLTGDGFTRSPYTRGYLQAMDDQGTPWRYFVADPAEALAATGWQAEFVDEPGTGTADYGRWPYPRMNYDEIPPAVRADLPRTYLVRAVTPSSPVGGPAD